MDWQEVSEADEPDDDDDDENFVLLKTKGGTSVWDNINYDNSEITFQVEEYKRPKFEVTFRSF
jgi:hypothetical protein